LIKLKKSKEQQVIRRRLTGNMRYPILGYPFKGLEYIEIKFDHICLA